MAQVAQVFPLYYGAKKVKNDQKLKSRASCLKKERLTQIKLFLKKRILPVKLSLAKVCG